MLSLTPADDTMERALPNGNLQWERGKFPPPAQVLDAALAKIEMDGSVSIYDAENNEQVVWEAGEPVELNSLPNDVYESHLLQVSRSLFGTVAHIANWPHKADRWLESLAIHLAEYRHNLTFLQEAASLGHIDKNGLMHEPNLPLRSNLTMG